MAFKSPAEQRDFLIYYAGVLRREAAARMARCDVQWMTDGADKAEREATAIDCSAPQTDLFASQAVAA